MHLNQSPSLQLASLVLITLFPIILSLPSPVFQHSSSHSSYRHHRRFTTPTDQKNLANTKDATKHVSSAPISLQSPHNLSSSSQKSNVPLDSAAPTTYTPIQADEKYDLTQASTWEELERMAEAQISASMTTLPTTVHFEEVPLSDDDFLEECEDEEDDYADVGSTNLTAANSEGNDGQTSSNSVDDWTEVPINSVTPPASPVKNDQSNDKDQKAEQDAASKKAEDAAAAKASQEGEEAEEKSDEEAAQKKSEEKEAKKEADAKKKGDEEYAKKQSDEADAKKESEAEEEKKEADEAEAKKKADEAQAKQSADEAEAKKKADEQAKKDAAAQAKADESKNKDQGSKDGGGSDSYAVPDGHKSGDATFYGTGLGACGITNNDQDYICAVSKLLFDSFPAPGGNPNENAICGRKIHATYKGRTVTVTVTDRCEACAVHDLDFSPKAFNDIGDPNEGRLHGMTWTWA